MLLLSSMNVKSLDIITKAETTQQVHFGDNTFISSDMKNIVKHV